MLCYSFLGRSKPTVINTSFSQKIKIILKRGVLMAKEEQKSIYLLAIVSIVAIVGIVILILQGGKGMIGTTMVESVDITGQAYTAETCPEAKLCAGTTSEWVTCSEQDGSCVCTSCAVKV